ncbi:hypothetical protein FLACOL7796_04680 [Flavobacterium collinsii]|uniref:Uncharacterized protein n=2 Tax=Flavobacterium collinsii TaxID=1114861 RepID=A0ABM8KQ47_9FLAO|nr:hypothetical protein FLACOL7796_04680 [Flavobacterium collinsii]
MKEDTLKYRGKFEKIWTSPVWSKVISAAIIATITVLYSIVKTAFENISIYDATIKVLNFEIEVYLYLIFSIFSIAIYFIINFIRKKINKSHLGFELDQKIGNFTFRELHNALLTHIIETPERLGTYNTPPTIDLLTVFKIYARIFNQGVQWEDDTDTYYKIGPTLMSYGIIEKTPTTNKLDKIGMEILQTSKIGYEFLAMLEKWRVYNNDEFEESELQIITDNQKKKK